jgi:hypothetical protein
MPAPIKEPYYADYRTTWTQVATPHSVLLFPSTKKLLNFCSENYGMTKKHIINFAIYEYYSKLKKLHGLPDFRSGGER